MSGLIPQAFIDELIHQTDIIEFIDSYVPLKKKGTSHVACCPFHHEKTPSFNVVAKKQFYHCFGCGASGNVISFAMSYLNQGFVEAIETLASRAGMSVPKDKAQAEKRQQNLNLYELLDKVSLLYQTQLKQTTKAIDYLKQRGLSGETAKRFQLGFAEDQWHGLEAVFKQDKQQLLQSGMLIQNDSGNIYDRYRNRIMFPIHDRHGRMIGFGGRAIEASQKPKYLNSPETVIFQKNRELYGLHQIITKEQTVSRILVVEGYMDVIMLAEHGIHNAVATLGTTTSSYHIQLLAKHCSELLFCFDGDEAGEKAAWRALENSLPHLDKGLDLRFIFLPDGQDPDSLVRQEGKEAFMKRLEQGLSLQDFFYNSLSTDINIQHAAGKTQLINKAAPFILKMPEGVYKQLIIDELAKKTHVDYHRLQQLMGKDTSFELYPQAAKIVRTPTRTAIALLLQNPKLYKEAQTRIHPERLEQAEHQILKTLIQHISANPEASTASLIELWRNTDYFESMNRLAAWEHQVPEQEQTKEFIDNVLFLEKKYQELKIQALIEKSRNNLLTDEERIALQNMLKERHEPTMSG